VSRENNTKLAAALRILSIVVVLGVIPMKL
jgi:hypothetical protein